MCFMFIYYLRVFFRFIFILMCVLILLVLSLFVTSVYWARTSPIEPLALPAQEKLLLHGVTVLDVKNKRLSVESNVYIDKGNITLIETGVPDSADGYRVIDAKGRYLLPGLMDAHVHVHDASELALNLAYGITMVRNLRGFPVHLRWREKHNEQCCLGSSLLTSSPVLDGPLYAHLLQEVVHTPEQGRAAVRRYHKQGFDSIKVYAYLDPEVQQAILAEAKEQMMAVVKHGPYAGGLGLNGKDLKGKGLDGLRGVQSLEHLEDIVQGPLNYQLDLAEGREYLQNLATLETFLTPTLASVDHYTELSLGKEKYVQSLPMNTLSPFFRFLYGEVSVKRWLQAGVKEQAWNRRSRAFLMQLLLEAHHQGVPLLVGSDAGTLYMAAGSSTHHEMALWQRAGLDNWSILQAATVNPAQAFGLAESIGQVKEGFRADLLLLGGNPLIDIGNLRQPFAVIKDGRYLGGPEIQKLKERGQRPASWFYGLGIFLEDLWVRYLER